MADVFNWKFLNLDTCSFELGDCNVPLQIVRGLGDWNVPPEIVRGLISRKSSRWTTLLKANWLLSVLGAGGLFLRASFAFCRDPHIAVTFIFLHLSCSQFKAYKLVQQKYAIALSIWSKKNYLSLCISTRLYWKDLPWDLHSNACAKWNWTRDP